MLKSVNEAQISTVIKRERPQWTEYAVQSFASKMVNTFDSRLDEVIREYCIHDMKIPFRHFEFTIATIQKLQHCDFLDALQMMDTYLKDKDQGRLIILSHIGR